jgi:hypothetical protein
MGEIFSQVGMKTSFQNVNYARLRLTTTAFPYLRAVSEVDVRSREENDQQVRLKIEAGKLNRFRTIEPKSITQKGYGRWD